MSAINGDGLADEQLAQHIERFLYEGSEEGLVASLQSTLKDDTLRAAEHLLQFGSPISSGSVHESVLDDCAPLVAETLLRAQAAAIEAVSAIASPAETGSELGWDNESDVIDIEHLDDINAADFLRLSQDVEGTHFQEAITTQSLVTFKPIIPATSTSFLFDSTITAISPISLTAINSTTKVESNTTHNTPVTTRRTTRSTNRQSSGGKRVPDSSNTPTNSSSKSTPCSPSPKYSSSSPKKSCTNSPQRQTRRKAVANTKSSSSKSPMSANAVNKKRKIVPTAPSWPTNLIIVHDEDDEEIDILG